jgi:two-component system, NtrC family, response regulator AtoC
MTEPTVTSTGLARVLLVDDDPTSRLALQTVLRAGGYDVDSAASAAEATAKLDASEYELVLTDLGMESPEAGYRVMEHARIMFYGPAAAVMSNKLDDRAPASAEGIDQPLLISPQDVPDILSKVADLIGHRATRRVARSLRQAG